MNLMELKAKANKVLSNSNSIEEISTLVKEMSEFSKQSWLDNENFSMIEATVCKLQIKRFLIQYYESHYSNEEYNKLINLLNTIEKLASNKNYTSSLALAKNYKKIIEQVHPIIVDIPAVSKTMCDNDGIRLLKTTKEYELIKENIKNRITKINEITRLPLFPKDILKDPMDIAINLLNEVNDKADYYIKAIINEEEVRFIKHYTEDIKNIIKMRHTFYPDIDIEENRYAKALVINSPFIDEVRLFIREYAANNNMKVSIIKANIFENMNVYEIEQAFNTLKKNDINCLIEGLPNFTNNEIKNELYKNILDYTKSGHYAFMYDNKGDNGLYKDFMDFCNQSENKYTLLDISFNYLSMPSFNDLIQLFIEYKMIESNLDPLVEEIRKGLPFMGFLGLNDVFVANISKKNWIDVGRSISNKNYTSEVKEYLAKIPNQSLLVDTGWGDFLKGYIKQETTKKEFDYDSIRYANPNNIKKIMEGGFTIFEKCGLLTRYCLLCGDDKSVWATLSRETQQNRVDEATKLVFQALGIYNIVPTVEILDEMPSKDTCGLCCDGGKRILYQHAYIQNYEGLVSTICHESFHAFQHMAEGMSYCRWFWTDLGVTAGRVEEWRLNHKKYFGNSDKDYNKYRYQIIEADANAFEKDCNDSAGRVWNQVDFE